MSGQKKEIHVRNLVIKADNVIFEPPSRDKDFDPFLGRRRRFEDPESLEENNIEKDDSNDEEKDVEERRRRFWI